MKERKTSPKAALVISGVHVVRDGDDSSSSFCLAEREGLRGEGGARLRGNCLTATQNNCLRTSRTPVNA